MSLHLDRVKPVHREGYRFIAAFAVATLLLFLVSDLLGAVGLGLTVWCYYFFRDPPRVTPARDGLVVSPADGVVSLIAPGGAAGRARARGRAPDPGQRLHERLRLPREPRAGRRPGGARRLPSGQVPERLARQGQRGQRAQRAGHRARRRARASRWCRSPGWSRGASSASSPRARRSRTGERFGLIRFGSRLDVYLPDGVAPLCCVGQAAVAGETVIADLASAEPPRTGEVR